MLGIEHNSISLSHSLKLQSRMQAKISGPFADVTHDWPVPLAMYDIVLSPGRVHSISSQSWLWLISTQFPAPNFTGAWPLPTSTDNLWKIVLCQVAIDHSIQQMKTSWSVTPKSSIQANRDSFETKKCLNQEEMNQNLQLCLSHRYKSVQWTEVTYSLCMIRYDRATVGTTLTP